MRILGIDPGSAAMGFGVVDWNAGEHTHVVHGTLRPPRSLNMAGRLSFLYEGIRAVIHDHEPDAAAVEQVFVSVSPRSAMVLGQARGAALAAVGASGISLAEYSASQIKQSTTGNGRAAKAQVQDMIRRLLGLDRVPGSDAADALAAAICHARVARFDQAVSAQVRQSGSASSRVAWSRGVSSLKNIALEGSSIASPKASPIASPKASKTAKGRARRL